MNAGLDFVEPLGHGLYAVDTGFHRPRFDAAYLIVEGTRAAFVDTGTRHAVPRLLAALDATGIARDAVDWVIPTHVHLDHAGGVGALMRELPAARVLAHPRGAPHLVDPGALYRGALAVYGQEEMDRSYGTLVGVPAERVDTSHDGQVVSLAGRPLTLIDTPGHARHHHCVWDEATAGWFTGDTFGLSYREHDDAQGRPWILPTTTPVQFEPDALRTSIARLLAKAPKAMYLTHYGRVGDVPRLAAELLAQLEAVVAIGAAHSAVPAGPARHAALKDALRGLYAERLRAHGVADDGAALDALALDIELNAQGMGVWLDRR